MPTRNVVLTERQEKLIAALVQDGRYQNASEVLLRLIERREAEDAAKLVALREAAVVGVAALERGEFTEFSDVDALVAYLDEVAERVVHDN